MPKIQIDVNRDIVPSQNPDFQYQANAKTMSVYFNDIRPTSVISATVRAPGDLGLWICANPDPEYWKEFNPRDNTYAFFDVPEGADVTVVDNVITYTYPKDFIEIQFTVGLDCIFHQINVLDKAGLINLAKYCEHDTELSQIISSISDTKEIRFTKDPTDGIKIITRRLWDSAENPYFPPCQMGDGSHLCGKADELNCKGCSSLPCANCKKEGQIAKTKPAETEKEYLVFTNDKLTFQPDNTWLNDPARIFPIYINAEITPGGVSSTALAGKFDGGNAAATLYDGTTTAESGVGGSCGAGDDAVIATAYDTDTIAVTLDDSYAVDQIKVWTNGSCPGTGWFLKVEYWTGSAWSDFGGTDEYNATDCNSHAIDFNSITERTTTKVRVNYRNPNGREMGYVNEVELYGAGAGTTETITTFLDALIQKNISKTLSLDSLLQKSIPITLSVDAILVALETISGDLDAQLFKSYTKTLSMDGLLQRLGITTSLSIDALLLKAGAQNVSLDAILYALSSGQESVSIDALLFKSNVVSQLNVDALLQQTSSVAVSIDAQLFKTIAKTLSVDALLTALKTISGDLDAQLFKSYTKTLSMDGLLQRLGVTTSVSVDALLSKAGIKDVSLDSLLQKEIIKITSLDAILYTVSAGQEFLHLDALLLKTITNSLVFDAYLQKQSIGTLALDAHISKLETLATSMDAILLGGSTIIDVSLDALLQKLQLQTASLDAMLYSGQIKNASLDAIVRGTLTTTVDFDALLQKEGQASTLMDAIIYSALAVATPKYLFISSLVKPDFVSNLVKPDFVCSLTKPAFVYSA